MIDSQAVIPAQACVEADDYDTSDFLTRVTDYFTVEDTLWPMPFNVSNPVLYYNKALFTQAGLDPETPPTTLDEITTASQKIVDAGAAPHGWALKLDPWLLEQWTAMAGKEFVDNGNGRDVARDQGDVRQRRGLVRLPVDERHGRLRPRREHRPGRREHQPLPRGREQDVRDDRRHVGRVGHRALGHRLRSVPRCRPRRRAAARSPRRWRDLRRRWRELHRQG